MKKSILPYSLRSYEESDYENVWQLYKACFEENNDLIPLGPWDKDLYNIQEVYSQSGYFFCVAEYDGDIIGMGAIKKINEKTGNIARMRVHPEYQRNGIGKAVFGELEKEAKKYGYHCLQLEVEMNLHQAQSFYKKNGFAKVGRTYIGSNECYIFKKSL